MKRNYLFELYAYALGFTVIILLAIFAQWFTSKILDLIY